MIAQKLTRLECQLHSACVPSLRPERPGPRPAGQARARAARPAALPARPSAPAQSPAARPRARKPVRAPAVSARMPGARMRQQVTETHLQTTWKYALGVERLAAQPARPSAPSARPCRAAPCLDGNPRASRFFEQAHTPRSARVADPMSLRKLPANDAGGYATSAPLSRPALAADCFGLSWQRH